MIDTLNFAQIQDVLHHVVGKDKALALRDIGNKIPDHKARLSWFQNLLRSFMEQDTKHLLAYENLKYQPVDVRTFIEDPYFMDAKGTLYLKIMECLVELNNGEYQEAIFTGSIGSGKTTAALYSIAYQLYLLSCYVNPHAVYELDESSEILFIFQSLNATLAKAIDFDRFKTMIEKSQYFKEHFPFDKDIISELRFPNRIIVKPIAGTEAGAIGQNVLAAIIDEINFMAIIEKSKSSDDGGTYDQAFALYNSISQRRKSRFMSKGKIPGLLCMVSSKRFPGQFTDIKEAQALKEIAETGKTSIYVYDKRSWDVKDHSKFSGQWFDIFVGDEARKPYILQPNEEKTVEDLHLYDRIPEEYRSEFEADIMKALRNIAGVSTLALHPFIVDRASIARCTRQDNIAFGREWVDFVTTRLEIDPDMFFRPELPRFVHLDLAITGDSAGLAVGTVPKFVQVGDPLVNGIQFLPEIWIDGVLEIRPPKGGEILFYKVREVILALKKMGLNIRWVTLDTFQSKDTMQLLRQAGFMIGTQSVDTTTAPYECLKSALYDGRISIPNHPKLTRELIGLEKDVKKNKIDHVSTNSKDVADALAGVVFGLTTRRELWSMHGIQLNKVPDSLRSQIAKDKVN